MDRREKDTLVAECRASGMKAKAWCELKGIKYRYYVDCASRINKERILGSCYIRNSYVCRNCEKETGEATIVKAPTPVPVIKKSLASASTVAHVMYQKYVNAMPLSRQEKDWANQGVVLSRATLANWVIRAATDWLLPLWETMKNHLLSQAVIHADETVIQVLNEEGKKPSSESRMWVYCSGNTGEPPVVLYEYQPTRSGEHARRFLDGFHGFLQTDGYAGYNKVLEVTRCGCWSHYPGRLIIGEELPYCSGESIEKYCNVPVVGTIPKMPSFRYLIVT